ncbi:hypothetical protein M9H77_36351 [Catharanthus roseus]|uniref:Uncharacterized protein n=1 Tax=Catharanthus roseus TaxID=4058 RepID=A0ACB9ZRI9_CATRO|nr:hypothetical protein M9H77_36351 [Catharanthus roseus]
MVYPSGIGGLGNKNGLKKKNKNVRKIGPTRRTKLKERMKREQEQPKGVEMVIYGEEEKITTLSLLTHFLNEDECSKEKKMTLKKMREQNEDLTFFANQTTYSLVSEFPFVQNFGELSKIQEERLGYNSLKTISFFPFNFYLFFLDYFKEIKLFSLIFIEYGDHFTFLNSVGTYFERKYFIEFNSIPCAIPGADEYDFNISNCASYVLGVENRRSMGKELGPILEDLSISLSLNPSSLSYKFSPTYLHHNINERKEAYHGVRKQKCWRNTNLMLWGFDNEFLFKSIPLLPCYGVFELNLKNVVEKHLVYSSACVDFLFKGEALNDTINQSLSATMIYFLTFKDFLDELIFKKELKVLHIDVKPRVLFVE